MDAATAIDYLRFMPQKGAGLVSKVIRSAMANAENNFEIDPNTLYVESIFADGGPIRRWRRFGARGRYKPIQRRTSHVTVVLRERTEE
jgi:large subunit ribosomal protein L22